MPPKKEIKPLQGTDTTWANRCRGWRSSTVGKVWERGRKAPRTGSSWPMTSKEFSEWLKKVVNGTSVTITVTIYRNWELGRTIPSETVQNDVTKAVEKNIRKIQG